MDDARTAQAMPIHLDCDTGVDDALAIAYLVASPAADLVGVGTVSGNTDASTAARNTLDLLALLGRPDVPVAVGERDFLAAPFDAAAAHVHGGNGVGGVELHRSPSEPTGEHAADLLVRAAREHPGELRVVATGPLTNLAVALRREPSLPGLVAGVTIMGGAALVPGDVTPLAEANVHNDPEAAAEVLAAGWDVTLVPLDVTVENLLEERQRAELAGLGHPATTAVAAMLEHYLGFCAQVFGRPCAALHDPLAAAIAVDVVVDTTAGPGRGQTVCDLRDRFVGYPWHPGAHPGGAVGAAGLRPAPARHAAGLRRRERRGCGSR